MYEAEGHDLPGDWRKLRSQQRTGKNLFYRQRRKQRLLEHGYIIRLKGRPRKNEADESIKKDKEFAGLRMQVDLLQNFLYEVGRR